MANNNKKKLTASSAATDDGCFFCTMKEPDLAVRRAGIMNYFRKNYHVVNEDDQELVLVLRGLWSIAMTEPNSEEFPSLGIFEFTANLIKRCVSDRRDYYCFNSKCDIYYIPYYAAHIIGSYTMNSATSASRAVDAGVIPPLLDLLRGKMTWIEQRVAVRALGHLASYESTFEAVAVYEDEVVRLAVHVASTCVDVVYNDLVGVTDKSKKLKYHCDLLTGGTGGVGDHADVEKIITRKAEEWTSQLQCWCLHLLNCFAVKKRTTSLEIICKPDFLKEVCGMWGRGRLMTSSSPAGIGLLRILCHSKIGRRRMAESKQVIENLCNISRSSDDWQYMGIDCLLLLLEDSDTRYKGMEITILCLVDLIELREIGGRNNFGEKIIKTLVKISRNDSKINKKVEETLDKIHNFNNLRVKNTCKDERTFVKIIKQQASHRLRLGKMEEAIEKYTEAIEICPLRFKKQRMALYSNRGQCHLLLRNAEAAISDTTRALCISKPTNSHCKSLWRRSQAYDMKGLAKESLMDCINGCFKYSRHGSFKKVPYYAIEMICKQMDSTWLFKSAQLKILTLSKHPDPDDDIDLISHVEQNCNGASLRSICTVNKGFMAPGMYIHMYIYFVCIDNNL